MVALGDVLEKAGVDVGRFEVAGAGLKIRTVELLRAAAAARERVPLRQPGELAPPALPKPRISLPTVISLPEGLAPPYRPTKTLTSGAIFSATTTSPAEEPLSFLDALERIVLNLERITSRLAQQSVLDDVEAAIAGIRRIIDGLATQERIEDLNRIVANIAKLTDAISPERVQTIVDNVAKLTDAIPIPDVRKILQDSAAILKEVRGAIGTVGEDGDLAATITGVRQIIDEVKKVIGKAEEGGDLASTVSGIRVIVDEIKDVFGVGQEHARREAAAVGRPLPEEGNFRAIVNGLRTLIDHLTESGVLKGIVTRPPTHETPLERQRRLKYEEGVRERARIRRESALPQEGPQYEFREREGGGFDVAPIPSAGDLPEAGSPRGALPAPATGIQFSNVAGELAGQRQFAFAPGGVAAGEATVNLENSVTINAPPGVDGEQLATFVEEALARQNRRTIEALTPRLA